MDDEVTTCEHCGKRNLKCTVVMSALDADGNEVSEVRFGRDCAANAMGKRWRSGRAGKMEQEARATALDLLMKQRKIGGRKLRLSLHKDTDRWPAYCNLVELMDGRFLVQLPDEREAWIERVPAGDWTKIKPGWMVGTLHQGSTAKLDLAALLQQAKRKANPQARWSYAVPNRPIGYATVPSGWVEIIDRDDYRLDLQRHVARHGVVIYDRPLTDHEVYSYELIPVVEHQELVQAVADEVEEGGYVDEFLRLWTEGDKFDKGVMIQAIGHAWDRLKMISLTISDRHHMAAQVYLELTDRRRG